MNPMPTIVDLNLPLHTALRAAAERGQILQCNAHGAVMHTRLLPGFDRICGGGQLQRFEPTEPEAA